MVCVGGGWGGGGVRGIMCVTRCPHVGGAHQVNLLTARAVAEMKRAALRGLAESGELTPTDVHQFVACLNSAIYALDTVRYSPIAPLRFSKLLDTVSTSVPKSSGQEGTGARASAAPTGPGSTGAAV